MFKELYSTTCENIFRNRFLVHVNIIGVTCYYILAFRTTKFSSAAAPANQCLAYKAALPCVYDQGMMQSV